MVENFNGFPKFDLNSYMNDDAILLEALSSLIEYGAIIVENVRILNILILPYNFLKNTFTHLTHAYSL